MKKPPPNMPCSDRIISLLQKRILDGKSKPGMLLAELAVAQELGVSRVPVREALFALERDGLVEFSETGRAYVKDLSPRDFEELLEIRLVLEPAGARLMASAMKKNVSRLQKNIAATRKARQLSDVTRLDLEFHEIILEQGGNSRLLRLWHSIRSELELWLGRLHRQHWNQENDTRELTASSHEKLVEAFRTQSPAVSERLMRQHIIAWREWLPAVPEDAAQAPD
jgi:DNA-binding GntR family transcriptional regulator